MALMVYKAEMSSSASMPGALGESFKPFLADAIRDDFLRAAPQSRSFAWLGPSPRITRRTGEIGEGIYTTTAVWIGAWPPDTTRTTPAMRGVAQPVAESIKRELDTVVDTWSVEFMPYNESLHGSLDQWRSGAAANTRTRDSFPSLDQDPDNVFPSAPRTPRATPQPGSGTPQPGSGTPQPEATGLGTIAAVIVVPLAIAWGLSYASDAYAGKSRGSRRSKRSL